MRDNLPPPNTEYDRWVDRIAPEPDTTPVAWYCAAVIVLALIFLGVG